MTTEDMIFVLIGYLIALYHLVWWYYDKAHFDSVDEMIHKTYKRNIAAINRGDFHTDRWEAFALWNESRGPFMERKKVK